MGGGVDVEKAKESNCHHTIMEIVYQQPIPIGHDEKSKGKLVTVFPYLSHLSLALYILFSYLQ